MPTRKAKPYTVTVAQQRAALAPLLPRLFIYTFYHPSYRNCVTLDCSARTQDEALGSAVRFLTSANERDARATGGARQIRLPKNAAELRRGT
jgi:hypothetical protein